ncbi:MAG: hypothetical protein AB1546_04010, partial [bacterium]
MTSLNNRTLVNLFIFLCVSVLLSGCGGNRNNAVLPVQENRSMVKPSAINYDSLLAQIDCLIAQVQGLVPSAFKNGATSKQDLLIMLSGVRDKIVSRSPVKAILNQLNNAVVKTVDGCAGNPSGAPDSNDMITECANQVVIHGAVQDLITATAHGGRASITISPEGPLTISTGETVDFSVVDARYDDGTSALGEIADKINWVSSNTSVGTVNPLVGSNTTLTGIGSGVTEVTGGVCGLAGNKVDVTVVACTIPQDGDIYTQDTTLCQGTYNLPGTVNPPYAIQLRGSDFTLDCNGARIIGPGELTQTRGISVYYDSSFITIKNCYIEGYGGGIVLYDGSNGNFLQKYTLNASGIGLLNSNNNIIS